MSQINRPPLGLQQLLGSQNFGDNPDQLAQNVQPSLDLFPFYASTLLRYKENTGSRGSEGVICFEQFFERAAILAISLKATTTVTTADPYEVSFTLSEIAGDGVGSIHIPVYSSGAPPTDYPVGALPSWSVMFPSPLVVEAGVKVNAEFDYATQVETFRLTVLYYDLGT